MVKINYELYFPKELQGVQFNSSHSAPVARSQPSQRSTIESRGQANAGESCFKILIDFLKRLFPFFFPSSRPLSSSEIEDRVSKSKIFFDNQINSRLNPQSLANGKAVAIIEFRKGENEITKEVCCQVLQGDRSLVELKEKVQRKLEALLRNPENNVRTNYRIEIDTKAYYDHRIGLRGESIYTQNPFSGVMMFNSDGSYHETALGRSSGGYNYVSGVDRTDTTNMLNTNALSAQAKQEVERFLFP